MIVLARPHLLQQSNLLKTELTSNTQRRYGVFFHGHIFLRFLTIPFTQNSLKVFEFNVLRILEAIFFDFTVMDVPR